MATIKIVKFKVRRGTDAQRRVSRLDQGEFGFTTDTKRLFIGNGILSGGYVAGSKVHPSIINPASLVNINAEVGDLVIANNIFYQLTATDYVNANSWANVGARLDGEFLEYDVDNNITLKDGGITPDKFNSDNILNGLKVDSGNLQLDIDTTQFAISSNKLVLNDNSINENNLDSTSFTNGITGGNGGKIGIKFDSDTLYLKYGDTLSLSALPANSITFNSIDSSWIGDGLVYDSPNSKIKTVVKGVDLLSLSLDISGRVGLPEGITEDTKEMAHVHVDKYGRIIALNTSIHDTLSCVGTLDGPLNALSALFTGSPDQVSLGGFDPAILQTQFIAISSLGGVTSQLYLTSAGFITFEGETASRSEGKYVNRFAIPIFAF